MAKNNIGKIILSILLSGSILSIGVYGLLYNYVKYPPIAKVDTTNTGLGAIERWGKALKDLSSISGIIGEDSYLYKEVSYANKNKDRLAYIDKIVSTVSYEPSQVVAKNIYGNDMILRGTDDLVYVDSLVNSNNEKVTLNYIDYSKIPLDEEVISKLMSEAKLKVGDVDYSNKLVDVYVKYILSLDELPTTSKSIVPNIDMGTYSFTAKEDIMLDSLLFSSEEFYTFLDEFSAIAGKLEPTKEWVSWSTNKEGDEPIKYNTKDVIAKDWCGAYYLLNSENPVYADLGLGTLEDPAGLNTGVVTSAKVDGKYYPIMVELVDFKVSEDAIKYFESKDPRNRGFDLKSKVQYASYSFRVTNLSNETITISDDSALADSSANVAPRTGVIYGLVGSLKLEPDASGIIESWGSSTELHTKYLLWGSSFLREEPYVWFRVLSGNLEDNSEYKGVYQPVTNDSSNSSNSNTSNSTSSSVDGISSEDGVISDEDAVTSSN